MYFGTSTTQSEPGCRFVLISGRAEFGLIEETIHDEWSLTLGKYNECFFEIVQASNALVLATLSCVLKRNGDGHSLFCIRIKYES